MTAKTPARYAESRDGLHVDPRGQWVTWSDYEARVAELTRKLVEAQENEARYLWLRKHYYKDRYNYRLVWYLPRWEHLDGNGLDSAIDTARQRSGR